jgi:hypothetical protein
MTDSTIFSSTYPTQGQDGFATTLNDFLREHDRLVMLTVENRTQTGAPAGVEGNAYIAASGVSGWTGTKDGVADQTYAANDVIAYLGGGWVGWAPQEGWRAYDKNDDAVVTYDAGNGAWQSPFGYGQIYVQSGSATQSSLTADTFTKITQFDTNGESQSSSPDHTNDDIDLNRKGKWLVSFQASFSGTNSREYRLAVFLNGSEQAMVSTNRKLGTGGDVGSCSAVGIVDVTTSGHAIDLRVSPITSTGDFSLTDGQLTATWLGV